MKKTVFITVLGLVVALCLSPLGALCAVAEETKATEETTWRDWDFSLEPREGSKINPNAPTSGTCGKDLTWTLRNGTLTVSGSGEMDAFSPWEESRDQITKVVFTGGVTKVGESAFAECVNLEYVNFGDSMQQIDTRAFMGCTSLKAIHLPVGFRRFGADSFRDCTALEIVFCDGGMPSFNSGCLWTEGFVKVYYTAKYAWPQEYVIPLVNNFSGHLQVMQGTLDVIADYEPEDMTPPTEAPTEPPTAAPTVVPTVPPIAAPTVPPVAVPTMPLETVPTVGLADTPILATEAPQEPAWTPMETQAPAESKPVIVVTDPAPRQREVGGDGWIGLVIVAAVLTLLLVGALVFRIATHQKGRYS